MKEFFDFLPIELAKKYYNFGLDVVSGRSSTSHVWTNQAWNKDIVEDSSVVVCIRLPDEMLNELQLILENKLIFDKSRDMPITSSKSAMVYVWSKNSYIPAHSDGIYNRAVTVYLNENWEYNDGGMFNWFDPSSQEWKNIEPRFNRAVVNDSGYLHGITPVKSSNNRITLQVFLNPIT
jgi:hypothetical protein